MTRAAQQVLKTFDTLPETDQQELAVEILRRAPIESGPDFDDSDFLLAADQVSWRLTVKKRDEGASAGRGLACGPGPCRQGASLSGPERSTHRR